MSEATVPLTWVISWWSRADRLARRLSRRPRGSVRSTWGRLGFRVKVAPNLEGGEREREKERERDN